MNTIKIGQLDVVHELENGTHKPGVVGEFFVDSEPLSKMLEINRGDMGYASDDFNVSDVRNSIIRRAVRQYTGLEPPYNQFGSPRLVIYRCACGSDYCGVISFTLAIEDGKVFWKDIAFETENQLEPCPVNVLEFDKAQYLGAFESFSETISESKS